MYRITFNLSDLKPALNRLSRIVSETALFDMQKSVLLKMDGNVATLIGTDTQLTMVTSIPCEGSGQVSVAITIGDLQAAVKAFGSNPTMTIEVIIGGPPERPTFSVRMLSGKISLDYSAFDPNLYPALPPMEDADVLDLEQDMVLSMITAQHFCGMMTIFLWSQCVAVHTDGDSIRVVACGHHTMYESKLYPGSLNGRKYILLPQAAMGVLSDLPSTMGVQLLVPKDDTATNVAIRNDGTTVFVRLPDTEYVKYKANVPNNHTKSFVFNADELLSAVRSISIGTDTVKSTTGIQITVKDLLLTVTAKNLESGKTGTTSIELLSNTDGDITISLSVPYLITNLSKLSGETKLSHGGSPVNAILLTDESESATQLIMPIRPE